MENDAVRDCPCRMRLTFENDADKGHQWRSNRIENGAEREGPWPLKTASIFIKIFLKMIYLLLGNLITGDG